MPEQIAFSWTGSPRASSVDPWARKPAWASVAGFGCAALSSTASTATEPHWVLLEETPRVGRRYPLAVWLPYRGALGEAIWVVYPPPAADPEAVAATRAPSRLVAVNRSGAGIASQALRSEERAGECGARREYEKLRNSVPNASQH